MDLRLTKPINAKLLLETIEKYCALSQSIPAQPTQLQDPLSKVVRLLDGDTDSDKTQAIDAKHIAYLHSIGDDAFVRSMIDGFIEDVSESTATMLKSLDEADPALFRFAAHAFKSSSNNIGARQLSALCERLEKLTEAEFNAKGRNYFSQVEYEVDRALNQLRTTSDGSSAKRAAN